MKLEGIKVVSWDVDGTLYSLPAFMGALKGHLIRGFFSLRMFQTVIDFLWVVRFKLFMDAVRKAAGDYRIPQPVPGRDRIATAQVRMYQALLPRLGLLPGVRALLDWLATQGVQQVVLSDYLPTGKLAALEVEGDFDRVFTGEEFAHLKPCPVVFERMIAALGIAPHELLHIGDRVDTDAGAASTVGYRVAVIGRDFASAGELLAHLQAGAEE
jgi:FMN phosphatase YigB (HAD superfamily)